MANIRYSDEAVGTVLNEDGLSQIDFRVEGDTDDNLLFADASADAVAIGNNAPTAFLHLKASTTAKASLRFPSSTAPTSPNEGDMWNDSTDLNLIARLGGINQFFNGSIFKQTATVTVSNTTTATTLTGSGRGTLTIPSTFWAVGRTIKVIAGGFYGTSAASSGNFVTIKLGATNILQTAGDTLTANIGNNRNWVMEAIITCRATGAGGSVIGQGLLTYSTGGSSTKPYPMQNLATVAVNTTGSLALDVTTQWGTADVANIMNLTNLEVIVS